MAKTTKGNSGNHRPVGIPQPSTRIGWVGVMDVRQLAKAWTTDSINTLAEIMKDKAAPPNARVVAAQALLDRGWGKSAQIIEATVGNYDRMSDDELIRVIEGTIISDSPSSGRIELEEEPEGLPE